MKLLGRFWKHLKDQTRRHFITGLIVTVPLVLTFIVVSWIVGFIDQALGFLPERFHPDRHLPFKIPGLGIILTLAVIQTVGLLSTNLFGRTFVRMYERLLDRIPFVRGIYLAVKQLIEQIIAPSSDRFRRAVLVQYPRKGIYSIGFVTGISTGIIDPSRGKVLNVFIPTTPNPTSGYYLLIPEDETVPLDLTVEEAFKLIVSAGMVGGGQIQEGGSGESPPLDGTAR